MEVGIYIGGEGETVGRRDLIKDTRREERHELDGGREGKASRPGSP